MSAVTPAERVRAYLDASEYRGPFDFGPKSDFIALHTRDMSAPLLRSDLLALLDALETAEAQVAQVAADALEIDRERMEAEAKVQQFRDMADEWESEGIPCECGHGLGEHNGLGCYAVVSYTPSRVVCTCSLIDDRHDGQLAALILRAALADGSDQ